MSSYSGDDLLPEGIFSLLDTDLYKLTMQSAVLKYFPQTHVTYTLKNRTPDMKLNRKAVKWLQKQIDRLANIEITDAEAFFLKSTCPYLSEQYLRFLFDFQLNPSEHVSLTFTPSTPDATDDTTPGDISLTVSGLWTHTILYEVPLLALTSEAYFRFIDTDWSYDNQLSAARTKGLTLLKSGIALSEFGSRRRRSYHTQNLVLRGLISARDEAKRLGWPGVLAGTSNVHFAHRLGLAPVGTVAHEWFMGVAAVSQDYRGATERALGLWVGTFGRGVLAVALTDTFGTEAFLQAFAKKIPRETTLKIAQAASNGSSSNDAAGGDEEEGSGGASSDSFAAVFTGVRQDSGDPVAFVGQMAAFCAREGIDPGTKTIVFSDSLDVAKCIEYKAAAERAGFKASFGVGTFLTNDFTRVSDGSKSAPLNIVIKLASADGKAAVKISDNVGKNTGDEGTVKEVKKVLGYEEKEWAEGDESTRWGGKGVRT